MNDNDILLRTDELDWRPTFPGGWIKRLRSCEAPGQWTQLLKLDAGAAEPPHYHLGAGEFIVLSGELHDAGGTARAGGSAPPQPHRHPGPDPGARSSSGAAP